MPSNPKPVKTKPVDNSKKLSELESKNAELQEQLARSLADYSNLEKRIDSQRQMFITLATVSIIAKMIDILDDLNLTQAHLQDQGLKISIDKFTNVLKSEGLAEIKTSGQNFDPAFMECVDTAEGKENSIVSVKKTGYTLNGQVIRPAQVVVGREKTLN
jgi:molecular chaperone GrpE